MGASIPSSCAADCHFTQDIWNPVIGTWNAEDYGGFRKAEGDGDAWQADTEKGQILAARRGITISRLLAQQIERLVRETEEYGRAKRRALALLKKGFHMGGVIPASREDLHLR
jgi:hypothetical protein